MAAGSYNFIIEQGATFRETWKRSGVSSATGYSARMDIRASQSMSATLILALTVANGRITLSSDGTNLVIDLVVTSTITATLTPGTYYYDLEIVEPDADVERLLMGTVTVTAEVTAAV